MNEQNNYQQPAPQYQQPYGPVRQLNTRRGLLKLILLTIITFGIYPFVFFSGISEDINLIASRFDGKKDNALLPYGVYHRTAYIRYWLYRMVP